METRNIESLHPNPNNDRILDDNGKRLLLEAMSLGNHGTFLITPEGMIINGNNRWHLRVEAEWQNKNVPCRILTFEQDPKRAESGEKSYYALIDGEIVKQHEVIPHYYISIEALYHAYSFTANGEAAYYDAEAIGNKFEDWQLDPDLFQANFFPPKSITETLEDMKKHAAKKKYQLIVACESEADMDEKYSKLMSIGIMPKRKI